MRLVDGIETEPYVDAGDQQHEGIFRVNTRGYNEAVHPVLEDKLYPREKSVELGDALRTLRRKVVFTSGSYDMLHVGHGRYLHLGRSLGGPLGALVVGLNSDYSVRSYKGEGRPILKEQRRAEMLAFMEVVDHVILYDERTAENLIREIKPDVFLCIEENWVGRLQEKPEVIATRECGGLVYCAPRQAPELSTSAIIEKLEADGMQRAAEKLQEIVNAANGGNGRGSL